MAVKIRLARHGKKAQPFYHIVATDSRTPRDGKFIEKLGTYNPVANPAKVEVNFDRTLYWLQNGALPSDTARSILRKEGIMYMKHLLTGVRKGSFDQSVAEQRFAEWKEKQVAAASSLQAKMESAKDSAKRKAFEAEKQANNARVEKIAKKLQEASAAVAAAQVSEAPEAEAAENAAE